MNLTIYHNPRCSKSRQTLELIRSHSIEPTIVEYLSATPPAGEILRLARALSVDVADLLRTGEADYASAGDSLPAGDNEALADWLNSHPKVLQRPIVVDNDSGRAIIGRPPENVLELLKA